MEAGQNIICVFVNHKNDKNVRSSRIYGFRTSSHYCLLLRQHIGYIRLQRPLAEWRTYAASPGFLNYLSIALALLLYCVVLLHGHMNISIAELILSIIFRCAAQWFLAADKSLPGLSHILSDDLMIVHHIKLLRWSTSLINNKSQQIMILTTVTTKYI